MLIARGKLSKSRCLDSHKKDDNWAFDEFAQSQGEVINAAAGGAGVPGGACATLELKFDCAFDDDDSRLSICGAPACNYCANARCSCIGNRSRRTQNLGAL